MKIIIVIIALFWGFSTAHGQEWEYAYPTLDITFPYEYKGLEFREAYVKYRILNEGTEMQIDMHDQIIRSGFMPERLWNRCCGPDVPVTKYIGDKDLRRVLVLVSEMQIDRDANMGYWFFYPNFELLNDWLDPENGRYTKEAIAEAFKKMYPNVTTITLWIGSDDYRSSHMSEIRSIRFLGDASPWKRAFEAHQIDLR